MISADLISRIAQLQVSFLLLLKLKDYEKIQPLQHFSCLEETTAGIVKLDLLLSENQTKNTLNIPHSHLSLTFILVHHRIEQKDYRMKEFKLNTEWAHHQ